MHSISCTDLEWERIRERAERAGLRISPYIVKRGLAGKTDRPPSLVLGEAEQRALHDRIARIEERVLGGARPDSNMLRDLRVRLTLLLVNMLVEHHAQDRDPRWLLSEWLGEDKASEIIESYREFIPQAAARSRRRSE